MEMIRNLKERRVSLAHDLNDTLSDLERRSGIFLVKPMYSYQGMYEMNLFYLILLAQNR